MRVSLGLLNCRLKISGPARRSFSEPPPTALLRSPSLWSRPSPSPSNFATCACGCSREPPRREQATRRQRVRSFPHDQSFTDGRRQALGHSSCSPLLSGSLLPSFSGLLEDVPNTSWSGSLPLLCLCFLIELPGLFRPRVLAACASRPLQSGLDLALVCRLRPVTLFL